MMRTLVCARLENRRNAHPRSYPASSKPIITTTCWLILINDEFDSGDKPVAHEWNRASYAQSLKILYERFRTKHSSNYKFWFQFLIHCFSSKPFINRIWNELAMATRQVNNKRRSTMSNSRHFKNTDLNDSQKQWFNRLRTHPEVETMSVLFAKSIVEVSKKPGTTVAIRFYYLF